jgi:hypothetical protein
VTAFFTGMLADLEASESNLALSPSLEGSRVVKRGAAADAGEEEVLLAARASFFACRLSPTETVERGGGAAVDLAAKESSLALRPSFEELRATLGEGVSEGAGVALREANCCALVQLLCGVVGVVEAEDDECFVGVKAPLVPAPAVRAEESGRLTKTSS